MKTQSLAQTWTWTLDFDLGFVKKKGVEVQLNFVESKEHSCKVEKCFILAELALRKHAEIRMTAKTFSIIYKTENVNSSPFIELTCVLGKSENINSIYH